MVTVEDTLKIRVALLPEMASRFAPGPPIVIGVAMAMGLASTIVPVGVNTMLSFACAPPTAARRDPAPASLRLVTVSVEAINGRLVALNADKTRMRNDMFNPVDLHFFMCATARCCSGNRLRFVARALNCAAGKYLAAQCKN